MLDLHQDSCKKHLENLHKNIKVLTHPAYMIFYWSRHEKMIIIDTFTAFIGGIDCCLGRWDTHSHPIKDLDGDHQKPPIFPGPDYNNPLKKDYQYDFIKGRKTDLNREKEPRMPWHDVGLKIQGDVALDLGLYY